MKNKALLAVMILFLSFIQGIPGFAEINYRSFALGVSPDPFAFGVNGQYWFSENYGVQVDYLNTSLATAFIGAIIHIVSPGANTDSNLVQLGLNYRPNAGFFQTIYSLSAGQATLANNASGYLGLGAALKIGDGPVGAQIGIQGIAGQAFGVLPYLTLYGNF